MAPRIFFHTFSMALYHKWDVKNDFAYLLQFFSLISDSLGSVKLYNRLSLRYYHVASNLDSSPFFLIMR